MCGFCIESAYFEGELGGSHLFDRVLRLMEDDHWRDYYRTLDEPTEWEIVIALCRDLDDRKRLRLPFEDEALIFSAPQQERCLGLLGPFAPSPSALVSLEKLLKGGATDQFDVAPVVSEFVNRYFVLPLEHPLALEGDWPAWDPEREPFLVAWAYLGLTLTRAGATNAAAVRGIPFLDFKQVPSFLGFELWLQRRVLTLLVETEGVGVFRDKDPIRRAILDSTRRALLRNEAMAHVSRSLSGIRSLPD